QAKSGVALGDRRAEMKADGIPDGPQILLSGTGDRKTRELGEAAALFERRADLAQELRGPWYLEITAAHLRPSDAAALERRQGRVDFLGHGGRQDEQPIARPGQLIAGPHEGTMERFAHAGHARFGSRGCQETRARFDA